MDIINWLFGWVGEAIKWVINLLPDSPFQMINNSDVGQFIGYLNWIIPISPILAILQAWLVAVGIFYAYKVILKWIRAI